MNLVIDCFKLVKGAGKSIGIYNLAKSIVVHLGERALQEQAADSIIVLGNTYNREEFEAPGVTFVEVDGDPLNKAFCILWELVLVAGYAKRYGADRILFPRGYRPLGIFLRGRRGRVRDTILIHDLIPFYYHVHYPGVFNPLENAYIMARLKASIKGADRIITISEYSRRDILHQVPGCGERIRVISNGVNDVAFEKDQSRAGTGGRADTGEGQKPEVQDYIIAMTSGLPHKNAKGVLRAYEAYYRQAAAPLELVVIGIADTSSYQEMDREAAAHVACHKYIGQFTEMCRIAAGARAYLFLSYMEGFGFPPLEAMQLGVPVVCSHRSSLPEVVGEAGLLVDPDDPEAVAEALVRATEDQALRQGLIQKGYENIRRFSWESRTDLYWKELFR
ncbi:MAG: glycosyltransferase family 4 protein [Lachnospiraceae bacterium]|nr:glycosyltransferase family 4 protein [Lachnospiraceae bacterium]